MGNDNKWSSSSWQRRQTGRRWAPPQPTGIYCTTRRTDGRSSEREDEEEPTSYSLASGSGRGGSCQGGFRVLKKDRLAKRIGQKGVKYKKESTGSMNVKSRIPHDLACLRSDINRRIVLDWKMSNQKGANSCFFSKIMASKPYRHKRTQTSASVIGM